MKQKKNVIRKSLLLTKLVLTVALLAGGGTKASAEDIVIVNGYTIAEGWTNGVQGTYITYNQFTLSNEENCLKAATSGTAGYLTSNSAITISEGQRIVISSKCHSSSTTSTKIIIKTSETGDFNSSGSYTDKETFPNSLLCSSEGFVNVVSAPLTAGTYYIRFSCAYVSINSIKICDSYDLALDEDEAIVFNSAYNNKVPFKVKYTPVNGWNSLILPFSFSDYKTQLLGENHTIFELDTYSPSTNTLTFKKPSYVSANKPYIVYVTSAPDNTQGISVENISVSFNSFKTHIVSSNGVTFQGTYAPITKGNFTDAMYGVTSTGQVRPGDGVDANIKGYRAYFTGISAPADGARPTIVFENDNDAQGLSAVMWMENTKDAYNLQGQKVEKGRKGIYIVNGRKVVIK